jgi:hypothetical protein
MEQGKIFTTRLVLRMSLRISYFVLARKLYLSALSPADMEALRKNAAMPARVRPACSGCQGHHPMAYQYFPSKCPVVKYLSMDCFFFAEWIDGIDTSTRRYR